MTDEQLKICERILEAERAETRRVIAECDAALERQERRLAREGWILAGIAFALAALTVASVIR